MTQPTIFETVTPRHSLPLLFPGQAQKEFFVNEAHALIDLLLHPVIEAEASDPPPSAPEGEGWLVGPAASGDWSGREGMLAFARVNSWCFVAPLPGTKVYNRQLKQFQLFDGQWQVASAPLQPSGGTTIDSEARTAISALLAVLRSHGLLSNLA